MKKNIRRDFRRETQEILTNIKIPDSQISAHLQVAEFTIRRWRKGQNSPQPFQFERLKQLASGQLKQQQTTQQSQSLESAFSHEIIKSITEIPGRFKQLTDQIAYLQETCGAIKAEIADIKKKKMEHGQERKGEQVRKEGVA